ncbi:hypothetical protein GGI42DRAFT_322563 [Trichoderma sp. SZMC 28013]
MFGLAIVASNTGSAVTRTVYALLSGLDAATVGIIALAAVQLSKSTVRDNLTRNSVFPNSAAGILYNAHWYFPFREYVVTERWVSPRDFLIGLVIAQAFPGPNFNFAVFLGTLAASNQ